MEQRIGSVPLHIRPLWQRRKPMQAFFLSCFALGFVIVAYPFAPRAWYAVHPPVQTAKELSSRGQNVASIAADTSLNGYLPVAATRENRLLIPKIGVNIPVVEGGAEALQRGAWHLPGTAEGPENGNMVLSAHRFRYRPPSSTTFYLLDKLVVNDTLLLVWKGKGVVYRVTGTRIVEPTALNVLDPSPTPRLTLITCTPLFSTARRLVVVAEPVS